MRNSIGKLTAVILIFVLAASFMGINVSAESGLVKFSPEMAPTGTNEYWPYFDAWMATGKTVYQSFAVRFKAASSFVGGMMALYVEGNAANVNVKLYQWNTDYAASVAGTAKAEANFNPVAPDGSGSRMEAYYNFPSAQPAGEYVAVFEVQSAEPFFPLKSRDLNNNEECYVDGALIDVDFFGGIVFENAGAGGIKPLINERITFAPEKETANDNKDIFWNYFDTVNEKKEFIDFAVRFNAKSSFKGGMLCFYIENKVTLKASLYEWNTDYAASVAGTAKAVATFDVDGSSSQRVEANYSFDSAQPAGAYIVVFEVVSGTQGKDVLIQLKSKDVTEYAECFMVGEKLDVDFHGGILFENYDDGGFYSVEVETPSNPSSGDNGIYIMICAAVLAAMTCIIVMKKRVMSGN